MKRSRQIKINLLDWNDSSCPKLSRSPETEWLHKQCRKEGRTSTHFLQSRKKKTELHQIHFLFETQLQLEARRSRSFNPSKIKAFWGRLHKSWFPALPSPAVMVRSRDAAADTPASSSLPPPEPISPLRSASDHPPPSPADKPSHHNPSPKTQQEHRSAEQHTPRRTEIHSVKSSVEQKAELLKEKR